MGHLRSYVTQRTQAESPASCSAGQQSQDGGPAWQGNSAHSSASFETLNNEHCQPWSMFIATAVLGPVLPARPRQESSFIAQLIACCCPQTCLVRKPSQCTQEAESPILQPHLKWQMSREPPAALSVCKVGSPIWPGNSVCGSARSESPDNEPCWPWGPFYHPPPNSEANSYPPNWEA